MRGKDCGAGVAAGAGEDPGDHIRVGCWRSFWRRVVTAAPAPPPPLRAWRARGEAGLKVLSAQPQTDTTKLAAIGYCFGGSTALQLAYAGSDLKAVVTFHAALPTPSEDEAKAIKGKVLICHGAADTFIVPKMISAFKTKMDVAKVPMQFESYPGAVHSFTVKGADKKEIPGMAYDADADQKSWDSMQKLFKEVFAK